MAATLILPGLNGSSNAHWQRIWARERPHSMVVEQMDWACPVLSVWQRELDEALSQTGSAFLVAHSLGCLLAASYAERRIARRIKGALLVAPCALDATMELHPCLAGFGEEPLAGKSFSSRSETNGGTELHQGFATRQWAILTISHAQPRKCFSIFGKDWACFRERRVL